jgi:hypothetical protein
VTPPPKAVPLDRGLLERFRRAGGEIGWRKAPPRVDTPKGGTARIAHLHDEDARVEVWGTGRRGGVVVDSGPVGALALLLEIDRRGPPATLGAQDATRDPAFPFGSIVATWGKEAVPVDSRPKLEDLVELARYALA